MLELWAHAWHTRSMRTRKHMPPQHTACAGGPTPLYYTTDSNGLYYTLYGYNSNAGVDDRQFAAGGQITCESLTGAFPVTSFAAVTDANLHIFAALHNTYANVLGPGRLGNRPLCSWVPLSSNFRLLSGVSPSAWGEDVYWAQNSRAFCGAVCEGGGLSKRDCDYEASSFICVTTAAQSGAATALPSPYTTLVALPPPPAAVASPPPLPPTPAIPGAAPTTVSTCTDDGGFRYCVLTAATGGSSPVAWSDAQRVCESFSSTHDFTLLTLRNATELAWVRSTLVVGADSTGFWTGIFRPGHQEPRYLHPVEPVDSTYLSATLQHAIATPDIAYVPSAVYAGGLLSVTFRVLVCGVRAVCGVCRWGRVASYAIRSIDHTTYDHLKRISIV
jgi:hypothetical protein